MKMHEMHRTNPSVTAGTRDHITHLYVTAATKQPEFNGQNP